MKGANGRHVMNRAVEELDAGIGSEDADLSHAVIINRAETMSFRAVHSAEHSKSRRHLQIHFGGDMGAIFIAAAGEVDDDEVVLGEGWRKVNDFGDGMGALEGRNDAFEAGELHERFESLVVGCVSVLDAVLVAEPGVLGADGGIVEAGGDAVGKLDLAELILQQERAGALEDAE